MYKIFIALAILFALLAVLSYHVTSHRHIKSNDNFSEEINESVKELVSQMLAARFGIPNRNAMGRIMTEDAFHNLDNHFPDFFTVGLFNSVGRNYMDTLQYNEETGEGIVLVRIYKFYWLDYGIEIKFERQDDGRFLITFIAKDP